MLRDVSQAVGASDLRRAADISGTALSRGFRHPTFHNARALWAQQEGRHQAALDEFQMALTFTPRNPTLLNAIAMCLVRLNRPDEGVTFLDASLGVEPNEAQTHYLKGWACSAAGDQEIARLCYERAVTLRADYPEALAALAAVRARAGGIEEARALAARALALHPREPTAIVALAICDIAQRDFAAVERRLKPMLDDPGVAGHARALMLGLYADALDGESRFAEAFDAYTAKNEEFRRLHASRFSQRPRTVEFLERLTAYLQNAPHEKWRTARPQEPSDVAPREHIFVLGFLRSGTTLLEQVLAAHPQIVRVEERETLIDASKIFLTTEQGLDRLAALSAQDASRMRALYWNRVRSYGADPTGKVLVDKQPLNTFNLPLISKLFPNAKILFALRDPRDVVLSCFRRHFDITATMFELLVLEDAARFYDSAMTLAEACRRELPLNIHDHRYEHMIEDFDGSVRAVCAFAGIEWTDAMRDFGNAARQRAIRSPSAAQVRRELYSEGVGHWRNYRPQLAPILPVLRPWVDRFGYPPD